MLSRSLVPFNRVDEASATDEHPAGVPCGSSIDRIVSPPTPCQRTHRDPKCELLMVGKPGQNSRSASRASDPCVFSSDWIRIGYVRHERVRGNRAKSTSFEILKRLHDFVSRVHHKWPVVLDGLPNWLTSQDQNFEVDAAGILRVMVPDGHPVSWSERHQLATMHPLAAAANSAGSGQDVDECIETCVPGNLQERSGGDCRMHQRHWRVSRSRASVFTKLTGDHLDQGSAVRADNRVTSSASRF